MKTGIIGLPQVGKTSLFKRRLPSVDIIRVKLTLALRKFPTNV